MPSKKPAAPQDQQLDRSQRDHLNGRINAVQYAAKTAIIERHMTAAREAEPAAVQRARKLIEAHERKMRRMRERGENAAKRILDAAREAVLFGPPAAALKAVKQIETLARR